MAMQIVQVINNAHEDVVVAIAYDAQRKEIYSASEGDRLIKVWDQKTGDLLRVQQGHRGWVTSLIYAPSVKLLFSGSVDGNIGAWSEKGGLLQMMPAPGGPVFSLAWEPKHRIVVVGGKAILSIFRVDAADALRVRQARRAAQHDVGPAGNAVAREAGALPDGASILKKLIQPLKGPELSHSDVVKDIVVTEAGKIITGGYDKCLCFYDLEKPKESFRKVRKVHAAGVHSMAYDPVLNVILTGSIDGGFKVWSMEGRCLDKFDGASDRLTAVAHVPSTNTYWVTGRYDRLIAYDPRAPANVTEAVADPNNLHDFPVNMLFSPPGTDLVIAGSKTRSIVVWQYNRHSSHRVFERHEEWVEGLVVVRRDVGDEVYSAGADGKLLHWRLDAEQNCDIYRCMEEIQQHEGNIHAIIYHPDVECIVTGGEDSIIQLHPLNPQPRMEANLPSVLTDCLGRVTALAALPNGLLVAACSDRHLRVWDLNTMKLLSHLCIADAPITCMEYCKELQQLATCGTGRKAKIWDMSRPTHPRVKLVLDHHDPNAYSDDEAEDRMGGPSNMVWLTTSKLDSAAGRAPNQLVQEAIASAKHDVPEVTQIRWVPFKQCWVTAAEDDVIRMWNTAGEQVSAFSHDCGSIQCLYVCTANCLILAASMDRTFTAFSPNDPAPLAKYVGHKDVVRSIGFLADQNIYITGSWDRSLRLWQPPSTSAGTSCSPVAGTTGVDDYGLGDEGGLDNTWVSSYERAHPLTVPKALLQDNTVQVLQLFGILDEGEAGGGGGKPKKGRRAHLTATERQEPEAEEQPSSLAARLSELNRELLAKLHMDAGGDPMSSPQSAAPWQQKPSSALLQFPSQQYRSQRL